jgi:hypothetical protein
MSTQASSPQRLRHTRARPVYDEVAQYMQQQQYRLEVDGGQMVGIAGSVMSWHQKSTAQMDVKERV